MNPLLPEILESHQNDNQVQLNLKVAENLACFAGHFPGFPILPGAVQLDWAIQLGRKFLKPGGEFAGMEQIKFHSPILPGSIVSLNLVFDPNKNRLDFSYSQGENRCSSGFILLSA